MKAIDLYHIGSSKAPDGWDEIPEVSATKPRIRNTLISLQKLDGMNVCIWMISNGDGVWEPVGSFFKVSGKSKH